MNYGRVLYEIELEDVRYEVAKQFFSTYFYGIDVLERDGSVYLAVHEKSGIRPEYRDYIKNLLIESGYSPEIAEEFVSRNPIPLAVIIGVIVAGAVGYVIYRVQKSAEAEEVSAFKLLIAVLALAMLAFALSRL